MSLLIPTYLLRCLDCISMTILSRLQICTFLGCDGSVLFNSTSNNTAEKDAIPNLTLAGFDVINDIKNAVEEKCAKTVSCADILALAARDAVSTVTIISSSKTVTIILTLIPQISFLQIHLPLSFQLRHVPSDSKTYKSCNLISKTLVSAKRKIQN
ncbi:putative peroxidase [Medicago truncatula]|uniref:peroxidase n=1 Tax=Medicago truncatula TaxID=3880 RepID=A0A396JY46_MEDTR|nr:putative peroxidase [Medicago truncatula]